MASNKKGGWNKYLKERIPIGSLVQVTVLDRISELGIVIDANYGLVRNSWYLVHGLSSGKNYHVYPNEVIWLKPDNKEKGDEL